ncbi:MAG: TrkH family potassium uptake protein [Muribaculaceae bacterium]|nr:TrkH family potassium uptake protein [Muribaculaceae bacterium]
MRQSHIHKTGLINFPVLLKVVGWLLIVESAFLIVPFITSLIYMEPDAVPFLGSAAVTAIAGVLLNQCIHPRSKSLRKRESVLVTSLTWIVFSIFGMLPFIFGSPDMSVSDGFFEAMSGFTTTGVSIVADPATLSHGILIWRSMMQWIGGLGIILFTLAVIPMLNSAGGVHLYNSEVTGITHDKLTPRISSTAKRLWGIYLILTIALTFLLWLGPMGFFDSICHSLSTVSTGGFSTDAASIGAWDSTYITIVITVFMFIGGINFTLMVKALSGSGRMLTANEVFRVYCKVIVVTTIIFIALIALYTSSTDFATITVDALFQVISTITSTGYANGDYTKWGPGCMMIILLLMFVGGCAGSTSGGAKLDRMLTVNRFLRNEIYRFIHPNVVKGVSISGRVLSADIINKTVAFILIYIGIIIGGSLALSALGLPYMDAFYTSISCTGNTGLGGEYVAVPDIGKWILSFLMLTGRLEIYSVIVLFSKTFWKI